MIFLRFIGDHLRNGNEKQEKFQSLLKNSNKEEIKILFSNYDWNINVKS